MAAPAPPSPRNRSHRVGGGEEQHLHVGVARRLWRAGFLLEQLARQAARHAHPCTHESKKQASVGAGRSAGAGGRATREAVCHARPCDGHDKKGDFLLSWQKAAGQGQPSLGLEGRWCSGATGAPLRTWREVLHKLGKGRQARPQPLHVQLLALNLSLGGEDGNERVSKAHAMARSLRATPSQPRHSQPTSG